MQKPKVAIVIGKRHYKRMLSRRALANLESFADIFHHQSDDPANKAELKSLLTEVEGCITSWGVACFNKEVMDEAPKLRAIAHMGGSVKRIVSDAVWDRNIHVTSAALTLAEDVATTTLGIMIVAMKRIWPLAKHVSDGGWRETPYWPSREIRRKTIGIVAAGNVGKFLIKLLKPFEPTILVFDPYLPDEVVKKLGVKRVTLEELLRKSDIVSLHAPSLPSTKHLLNRNNLPLLKDGAVLINTARGSLIDERALIQELRRGRIEAWLDVTDPEPPASNSPLRKLPNVIITPHIAGCIEDCTHMGEMAVEELRRFFQGEPPLNKIMKKKLDIIS